jgi:Tol biopolymer transport system component
MMNKVKSVKSGLLKISIWLIILFLTSACIADSSTAFSTSTSIAEKRESTLTPDEAEKNILVDIPEGKVLFSCVRGIYQYDLVDGSFSSIDNDETRVYKFIGWNKEGIFYTRTTDYITVSGTIDAVGPSDLFLIRAKASAAEQITQDEYEDFFLSVSPQGGQVVYTSDREEPDRYKTVLLDLTNEAETILYASEEQSIATFSPHGDKVAVLHMSEKNKGAGLAVFDLIQDTQTQLLANENLVFAGRLSWSPDQTHIAFVEAVAEGNESYIELVNVKTGEIDKLITTKNSIQNLAWSPDGEMILYEELNYSNGDVNSAQLRVYDLIRDQVSLLHTGGVVDRSFFGYHALWFSNSNGVVFFVDNESKMSGPDMIIKNIDVSDEKSVEILCPFVRDSTWGGEGQ